MGQFDSFPVDGESFPTHEESESVTERRTLIFDQLSQTANHERETGIGLRLTLKSKGQLKRRVLKRRNCATRRRLSSLLAGGESLLMDGETLLMCGE